MSKYTSVCRHCGTPFESDHSKMYCTDCKPTAKDSIGKRFGILTVLDFESRKGKAQRHIWVLCRCDCGTEKWIRWENVRRGAAQSCGCMQKQSIKKANAAWKLMYTEKENRIIKAATENPGYTLQEIADVAGGVTREYVRQVMIRYGAPRSDKRPGMKGLRIENERLKVFIKANGLSVPVFSTE